MPPPRRIVRWALGARVKPRPSGPSTQSPSPACRAQRRAVPGPTSSIRRTPSPPLASRDREGTRQEGSLVGACAPALRRRDHRELARAQLRDGFALGVLHPQQPVCADLLVAAHRASRRPSGAGVACPACWKLTRPRRGGCASCSCCRQSTSGGPALGGTCDRARSGDSGGKRVRQGIRAARRRVGSPNRRCVRPTPSAC